MTAMNSAFASTRLASVSARNRRTREHNNNRKTSLLTEFFSRMHTLHSCASWRTTCSIASYTYIFLLSHHSLSSLWLLRLLHKVQLYIRLYSRPGKTEGVSKRGEKVREGASLNLSVLYNLNPLSPSLSPARNRGLSRPDLGLVCVCVCLTETEGNVRTATYMCVCAPAGDSGAKNVFECVWGPI